jgi:hypothetical protein
MAYTSNNILKTPHKYNHTQYQPRKLNILNVYKLKCNDYPKFHIAQTGRSFITQYTEHVKH